MPKPPTSRSSPAFRACPFTASYSTAAEPWPPWRLYYDGSDFDAADTLAVTVAIAGTGHSAALTTGTRAVAPARRVNVSTKRVALTEGAGAGSYTVVLESPPTGGVTVTATSNNAAVTVGGTSTSTTIAFTTQNWNTRGR